MTRSRPPTTASPAAVLGRAETAVARHGRAALAQIVRAQGSTPGKAGWKLLVHTDGTVEGNLGGGAFEAMVLADVRTKLAEARPEGEVKRYYLTEDAVKGEATGMVCGGMVEVFLEVVVAPPLLVVFGGGPVG
ncbi:MAG TPA: XdhC family protein, partial [Thermoanaerobaculia bacterium]|nr:XdhC family protein [Thermoanaerobaculia bacterium]